MERSPMLNFLSRDSILSHLSYLKDLRLKYSVFQKSVEAMIGSEGFRFSKIRNGRSFASEGDRILVEIELHDVYFDSFSDEMIRSEIIKKSYGSVDSFLYETYLFVKDKREGFLCFFKDRHGNIRLDFSVVNNMNYYNGVVFKGFLRGIPDGVLAGGEYGMLMKRMGKPSGAVGFAIYLDMLEELSQPSREYDVDVLVVYGEKASLDSVTAIKKKLIGEGRSVSLQKSIPTKLRYKEMIKLDK